MVRAFLWLALGMYCRHLYTLSPILLHGVVLSSLSTGTALASTPQNYLQNLLTFHTDTVHGNSFQCVTLTCHLDTSSSMTGWMVNTVAVAADYGRKACNTQARFMVAVSIFTGENAEEEFVLCTGYWPVGYASGKHTRVGAYASSVSYYPNGRTLWANCVQDARCTQHQAALQNYDPTAETNRRRIY
jgi:hypothetical protein